MLRMHFFKRNHITRWNHTARRTNGDFLTTKPSGLLLFPRVHQSTTEASHPPKSPPEREEKSLYKELVDTTVGTAPDEPTSDSATTADINRAFTTSSTLADDTNIGRFKDLDAVTQKNILSIQGFTPFHDIPAGTIEKLFENCPMTIQLLLFQQQGVGWMVRKELTGHGGILADHLGLGKTVQMIALIILNPLKLMKTDHSFVDEIIESAGSLRISQLQRMVTVCRLLYKLPGVGDCSKLLQPEINLFELAIYIEDRIQELVGCDKAQEETITKHCADRLNPWLHYAKRFYANYEKKCHMFIESKTGDEATPGLLEAQPIQTSELRTLIVVPMSILHQWRNELFRCISPSHPFSVYTYHSSGGGRLIAEKLEQYDFVLTTYDTLTREAGAYLRTLDECDGSNQYRGDVSPEVRERMLADKEKGSSMVFERNKCGPLFSIVWKRVVLDEAHLIRNKSTSRWAAVSQLLAVKKWCITATPMQNDISDLQNLLLFVKSPPLPLPSKASSSILLRDRVLQEAVARSLRDVILRREPVMTRCFVQPRSDGDSGPPRLVKRKIALLKLPPKIEHIELITASQGEVNIYNGLVLRMRRLTNANEGSTCRRSPIVFITLLCRLRQVCCHPWLVEKVNLAEIEVICAQCKDIVENPVKFVCGHEMCNVCLENAFEEADERIANVQFGEESQGCAEGTAQRVLYSARGALEESKESQKLEQFSPETGRGDKAKVVRLKCPHDNCDGFVARTALHTRFSMDRHRQAYHNRPFVSSSKIDTLLAILRQIKKTAPADKVVVFTHFVMFMAIIEIALARENIRYLSLFGSLRSAERAEVVETFQKDPNVRVLLASKLACGVGLNLTMANRVVVLDPWWNPGIEEQAVHRCHRIGQTKPVYIYRCITDKSVEYMCWQIANKKKIVGEMVIQSTMEGGEATFPVEKAAQLEETINAEARERKGGQSKTKKISKAPTTSKKLMGTPVRLIQSIGLKMM